MKAAHWTLLGCLIAAAFLLAPSSATADLATTARQALTGDAEAVKALRASGPSGMEALLTIAGSDPEVADSPAFNATLDAVCAQKDCAASHLYWYTDLETARAAAKASGRPILSLRLLGRLDEELSCANSRFFRTVLYANQRVSKELRDRFVLHWQSERPVPKVTVDFGDGRRLVGTVTGNSIHYILDSNGRLVDALPGLFGPGAFLKRLGEAANEAAVLAPVTDVLYPLVLGEYHLERLNVQARELRADRRRGLAVPARTVQGVRNGAVELTALEASEQTASKMAVEVSLLHALWPDDSEAGAGAESRQIATVARLHREDSRLDEASRRLLIAKGGAWAKGDPAQALERFEKLIAEDSVRNEYLLHNTLHRWLASTFPRVPNLTQFDERVYRELFLTPASDPWLGLGPTELFSVLTPAG